MAKNKGSALPEATLSRFRFKNGFKDPKEQADCK